MPADGWAASRAALRAAHTEYAHMVPLTGSINLPLTDHRHGYPAGSVTGPVALGVQMCYNDEDGPSAVRLLPDAEWPAGHHALR